MAPVESDGAPAKSSTIPDLGHNPVRADAQKATQRIKGHGSSLSGLHWGLQPGSGSAPVLGMHLKASPAASCQGKMATTEHSTLVIWKNRRWLFFISLLWVGYHYCWEGNEKGSAVCPRQGQRMSVSLSVSLILSLQCQQNSVVHHYGDKIRKLLLFWQAQINFLLLRW